MLIKRFKSIFQPEYFHGWGKGKRFFEGFYFKLVDFKEENCVVIIAGIAMDKKGINTTFFQILDGVNQISDFHTFKDNYRVKKSLAFEILYDDNRVSKDGIELNLNNVKGKISFSSPITWSKKWYSPGAMGPFTFLPYLECYHGILSMQSTIAGELNLNGKSIDFTKGTAYIEKDWGHSFPKEYIWIQCNHFQAKRTSLSVSLAKTKYFGRTFKGFLVGLYFKGELIEFTTYNFSTVVEPTISTNSVCLTFENQHYKLYLETDRIKGSKLIAPINGEMIGQVSESLTGKINLQLFDKKIKQNIFHEIGSNVGLEVEWKIKS